MNTDLQKLDEITDYYNGLQKEAAHPLAVIGGLIMRLGPKALNLASKLKWAKPAITTGQKFMGRVGARVSSTGQFGKGLVEGFKGAGINPYTVKKSMGRGGLGVLKGVAGTGRMDAIGISKGAMKSRIWGRRLGHFANVNTWSPYNKGFLVDAPLWAAAPALLSGGGKTNNSSLTPQELAYLQGNPVYDNYGYGYGYDA